MSSDPISVSAFVVTLLESAYGMLMRATDRLEDEQLYYQPAPGTNSIAWLAWHLSRWKDRVSAMVIAEPQVWVSQGWAKRFGMDAERTGLGDTPEQVAAFRVDRALLFGYVDAAHQATAERVRRMAPERLEQAFKYVPDADPRPAWRSLAGMAMDFAQHTGQIAYLRGLITGPGWLSR